MAKVISTKDMTRADWLEHRQAGIGGSDAGAILGLNKWKSPFEVYIEKTEPVDDRGAGEAAYWGNTLEDVVAQEFTKRTGKKVRRSNRMWVHPDYSWMLANVDRMVVGEYSILECKTVGAWGAKDWEGDKIPASYIVQGQHYLAVTGLKRVYYAVLIGGQRFEWKYLDRDEELIQTIIGQEQIFWDEHVMKKIPPALDGSSAAEKFLRERYPESDAGVCIALPAKYDTLLDELAAAKASAAEWEAKVKEIENQVKEELKEAEAAYTNRYEVTWKSVTSNRLDTKALKADLPEIAEKYTKPSVSRRFTIKQNQED